MQVSTHHQAGLQHLALRRQTDSPKGHQQRSVEHLQQVSEAQHQATAAVVTASVQQHLHQTASVEVLEARQNWQQQQVERRLSPTIQTLSLYNKKGIIE